MSSKEDSRDPMDDDPLMEQVTSEDTTLTKEDASLSGEDTGVSDGDSDLIDDGIDLSDDNIDLSDDDIDLIDDDIDLIDDDIDLTEEVNATSEHARSEQSPSGTEHPDLPDQQQQTETECVIPKDVFEALALRDYRPDLEIEDHAVDLMHLNAEDFVVRYLRSAQLVTAHREATTIALEDMRFTRSLIGMVYRDILPHGTTGQ
ncbi:hypothetical protein DL764_003866 [Monosporascus ibericus]|uniref:Uncharacterized protein n=1 Tax=Monosporascus ibericus TaxID=155417 RepID=A0A4Q4TJD8_9PEZI|nr:hypothetical protein DL764_003866 [Monosporascus ibericus]